jgi:hypothetical protein
MSRRGRSREGGAASGAFIAARAASAAHFRAAQTRREFRRGDLVEDRAEEYRAAIGAGPLDSSAPRQLWP